MKQDNKMVKGERGVFYLDNGDRSGRMSFPTYKLSDCQKSEYHQNDREKQREGAGPLEGVGEQEDGQK